MKAPSLKISGGVFAFGAAAARIGVARKRRPRSA